MNYLLDTHAVLWALEDDPRLGEGARAVVSKAEEGDLAISDISLLEISMLLHKGRIHVQEDAAQFLSSIAAAFRVLPIDPLIASDAMAVVVPQGDPFDRIILATARAHRLSLLTCDRGLSASGLVEVIW